MIDRAVLKQDAKAQISGSVGTLIGCLLVSSLMLTFATVIPFIGNVVVIGATSFAFARMHLRLSFGNPAKFDDLFVGLKDLSVLINVTIANILVGLFTFLWSLLFVIPGMMKALSYSMTNFVLVDNPGIGALEAIKESQRLMDGHKLELFILQLSFFPWYLLVTVTCGLATFYVTPYVQQTYANFYLTLKAGSGSQQQQW
jgi:uncharacterized membrane protein